MVLEIMQLECLMILKTRAIELDTYVNDEQIGSFVDDNVAAKTYTNEIMEYAGDMDYYGSCTG